MAAERREEHLCDLSNIVAFGHNEQWRPKAAKVATNVAKILLNSTTAVINTSGIMPCGGGAQWLKSPNLWPKFKVS